MVRDARHRFLKYIEFCGNYIFRQQHTTVDLQYPSRISYLRVLPGYCRGNKKSNTGFAIIFLTFAYFGSLPK